MLRAAALLAALVVPGVGRGATTAACRDACRTAVEGCIAWRGTALRDVEAPARVVRRKSKAIRRGCTRAAIERCRIEGVAACDAPVICACGR